MSRRPEDLASDHERAVIAGIVGQMHDGAQWFALARDILTAEDFSQPIRRAIWTTVEQIVQADKRLYAGAVLPELRRQGHNVSDEWIMSVTRFIPTTIEEFQIHVGAVARESAMRRLNAELMRIADRTAQPSIEIEEGMRLLQGIDVLQEHMRRPHTIAESMPTALRDQASRPFWCCLPVAEMFLRVSPGHLVVVGAESGKGKSQFALQASYAHALQFLSVYYVTYEMPISEVTSRLISRESQIDLEVLLAGDLDDDEDRRREEAEQRLADSGVVDRIEVDDSGPDIEELELRIRLAQIRNPLLGLVVVDHLQLVPVPARLKLHDERARLEYVVDALQRLGQRIKVPILLLSQFNRGVGESRKRKPTLDVLRGSAKIAQDANLVLLLWHPTGSLTSWVVVAKGRSMGDRGIPIKWRRAVQRFEDGPADARQPVDTQSDRGEVEPWPAPRTSAPN